MKLQEIYNTQTCAGDGFAGAGLAPALRMNSTGTIIRTLSAWVRCLLSLRGLTFLEVVMTNEAEIAYLVLAIVATLIVKFLLTKTEAPVRSRNST